MGGWLSSLVIAVAQSNRLFFLYPTHPPTTVAHSNRRFFLYPTLTHPPTHSLTYLSLIKADLQARGPVRVVISGNVPPDGGIGLQPLRLQVLGHHLFLCGWVGG